MQVEKRKQKISVEHTQKSIERKENKVDRQNTNNRQEEIKQIIYFKRFDKV